MIRVLIADDHKLIREAVGHMLAFERGIEVVGLASDGHEAVSLAEKARPDVVLMDIHMPRLNGIEATRRIVEKSLARVVSLSGHTDRALLTQMLAAGATGVVFKGSGIEEVVRATREVAAGRTFIGARAAHSVLAEHIERLVHPGSRPPARSIDVLTPREREVLQLIAEGRNTKQAAALLHLSVKTIETHRTNILAKLNAGSVADLTRIAIRDGLVCQHF